MSKKVQFPDGKIGVVSDKVAVILAKRDGHKVINDAEPKQPKPVQAKE
jgi:hypothetical protein